MNFEQELYNRLSKIFLGVKFTSRFALEDDATYIYAVGEDTEPFRIGSEDVREKSFDDIVAEAIKHFEGDEE